MREEKQIRENTNLCIHPDRFKASPGSRLGNIVQHPFEETLLIKVERLEDYAHVRSVNLHLLVSIFVERAKSHTFHKGFEDYFRDSAQYRVGVLFNNAADDGSSLRSSS